MRLIDADIVENIIMNWAVNEGKQGNKNIYFGAMKAVSIIKNTKTVDVVPVKHGHWVDCHGETWECSACGEENSEAFFRGKQFDLYCPKCGAKMDGVS